MNTSTNTKHLTVKTLAVFLLLVFSFSSKALTTKTWTGSTNSDFNTAGNWSPATVPSSSDSIVIAVTSGKNITLSGNITVGALYLYANNTGITVYLDCVTYLLTINGNLHLKSGSSSYAYLDVGSSAGGVTVGRHTFIDDGGSYISAVYGNTTGPGVFKLKGNLTLGYYAQTFADTEPDITFDGTGTQTVTANDGDSYFFSEDMIIGSTNNPTVVLTGTYSSGFGVYYGNANINGSSILDLASNELDAFSSTGTITIASGATIKIGGSGDFPSYSSRSLNAASNVYFNGTSQTVNAITYGNLYLQGSGTKTSSSSPTIAGNLTLDGTATYNLNASSTVSGNLVLNGANTMTKSSSGSLTVSGNLTLNSSSILNASGSVSVTGTTSLNSTSTFNVYASSTLGGAVTLAGTSVLDADAAIDFNSSLTMGSGTIFYGGTITHTMAGSWTNNGGSFEEETCRITFDGSSSATITSSATISGASSALWTEGFENSGSMPTGWNKAVVTDNGTDPAITFVTSSNHPSGFSPSAGSYFVKFNSYDATSGGQIRLYQTSSTSTVGKTGLSVGFAWTMDNGYSGQNDYVTVQYSTNGSSWTSVSSVYRYASSNAWTTQSVTLPAGAENQSTLYIAFLFNSLYGNDCYMDAVTLSEATNSSTGETFNNFTINKSGGAGISLSSDAMITSGITLTAGILTTTSSDPLIFDEDATASSTSSSSHVSGYIAKRTNSTTKFTFPCGDGTNYRAMAVTPSSTSATTWTAKYFNTGYADYTITGATIDHVSKVEYWTLDRSGAANSTIELSWNTASQADANYTDLIVAHYNGSDWEYAGGTGHSGSSSSGTLSSSSAWSSYSPFTLGSRTANNPLPVNMVSFETSCKTPNVEISWLTSSETNNDYYLLEKSQDGVNYYPVAVVDGVGNASEKTSYSVTDHAPYSTAYYRLKQVDFDGKTKFFGPIYSDCSLTTELNIFPNKTEDVLIISGITSTSTEKYLLQVFDVTGQLVYTAELVPNGQDLVKVHLSGISSGIYLISLTSGTKNKVKKINW